MLVTDLQNHTQIIYNLRLVSISTSEILSWESVILIYWEFDEKNGIWEVRTVREKNSSKYVYSTQDKNFEKEPQVSSEIESQGCDCNLADFRAKLNIGIVSARLIDYLCDHNKRYS